jgi:drug/metabolite transporter (DMT)-like permease
VAIALGGSALTIGKAGDGQPMGIALGFLAAVIYSCYILIGSRIPAEVHPLASSTVIVSCAALIYGGSALAHGVRLPADATGWAAALAVAVVCTVLAILFFFKGIERVGPVQASVYSTVELLVTLSLAGMVLGEPITLTRGLGGMLIIAAVLLLAREELRAARADRG